MPTARGRNGEFVFIQRCYNSLTGWIAVTNLWGFLIFRVFVIGPTLWLDLLDECGPREG